MEWKIEWMTQTAAQGTKLWKKYVTIAGEQLWIDIAITTVTVTHTYGAYLQFYFYAFYLQLAKGSLPWAATLFFHAAKNFMRQHFPFCKIVWIELKLE